MAVGLSWGLFADRGGLSSSKLSHLKTWKVTSQGTTLLADRVAHVLSTCEPDAVESLRYLGLGVKGLGSGIRIPIPNI